MKERIIRMSKNPYVSTPATKARLSGIISILNNRPLQCAITIYGNNPNLRYVLNIIYDYTRNNNSQGRSDF